MAALEVRKAFVGFTRSRAQVGTQGVGLCIHPLSFADWVRALLFSDEVPQLKEAYRSSLESKPMRQPRSLNRRPYLSLHLPKGLKPRALTALKPKLPDSALGGFWAEDPSHIPGALCLRFMSIKLPHEWIDEGCVVGRPCCTPAHGTNWLGFVATTTPV